MVVTEPLNLSWFRGCNDSNHGFWISCAGLKLPRGSHKTNVTEAVVCTFEPSLSQSQRAGFEGHLEQTNVFHNVEEKKSKEISHDSVAFASSTPVFERCVAQKCGFHMFSCQFLRESSHKNFVVKISKCIFSRDLLHEKCRFWGKSRTKSLSNCSFWVKITKTSCASWSCSCFSKE